MRQSQELLKHPQSSSRNALLEARHPPNGGTIYVAPSRPEIMVLSSPDPLQQLPSLFISAFALIVSMYALRKNLIQKRNEHRAKFFHEVAITAGLAPMLKFYEDLRRYVEKQGMILMKTTGAPDHDKQVMEAMRKVREIKRAAATQFCGLVSPFSVQLETDVQAHFDNAADAATEYLEACASSAVVPEPIAAKFAACQRNTIELLREHEFQLGWPSLWTRLRKSKKAA
jgi:hypothetical protein